MCTMLRRMHIKRVKSTFLPNEQLCIKYYASHGYIVYIEIPDVSAKLGFQ